MAAYAPPLHLPWATPSRSADRILRIRHRCSRHAQGREPLPKLPQAGTSELFVEGPTMERAIRQKEDVRSLRPLALIDLSGSSSMLKKIVASAGVIAVLYCASAVADAVAAEDAAGPTLPFKYLGKWTRNGRMTVFLVRDHYPYAARLGQDLDHEYRVDAIEANHAVLRYMPLGTRHVLVFSTEPLPFIPDETPASPRRDFVALTFSAPNQIAVEQDFLVGVGMQASPGLSASATVELSYDAALLKPFEGPSSGGRMSVNVNASGEEGGENKPAVMRFHVLTVNPQITRIEINVQARDADGRAVEIRAPDSHALRIIP
jgi:hypothetical protein